jgi:hypothetical protein
MTSEFVSLTIEIKNTVYNPLRIVFQGGLIDIATDAKPHIGPLAVTVVAIGETQFTDAGMHP